MVEEIEQRETGVFERFSTERINAAYRQTGFRPITEYHFKRSVTGEQIYAADPIGVLCYLAGADNIDELFPYEDLADILNVPVDYLVGFDGGYEQDEDVNRRVFYDDVHDEGGNPTPQFTLGVSDGKACRAAFIDREAA